MRYREPSETPGAPNRRTREPTTAAARVRSRARATSRLDPVVVELLSNIGRRFGEK